MSRYQHAKGQINDNAIEALLHDTRCFASALRRTKKGKGVIYAKRSMQNVITRRPVVKELVAFLPLAFYFLQ